MYTHTHTHTYTHTHTSTHTAIPEPWGPFRVAPLVAMMPGMFTDMLNYLVIFFVFWLNMSFAFFPYFRNTPRDPANPEDT